MDLQSWVTVAVVLFTEWKHRVSQSSEQQIVIQLSTVSIDK